MLSVNDQKLTHIKNKINMKNLILFLSALFLNTIVSGQTLDDAIRFSQTNLMGTARSAGMGNAFGALGGDFSSLSINPAGIAVYRSSELSVTPSFIFNNTSAEYFGTVSTEDHNSFPFNQAGFVGTYKKLNDDAKGIISYHFGAGYNRVNNFNQDILIRGYEIQSSQLGQFVIESDGNFPDQLNSFGSLLAFNTWLIDTLPGIPDNYFNAYEAIDEDGNIFWRALDGIDQKHIIDQNGYTGEYIFSFGLNISNVLMAGITFNVQNIHYTEYSTYSEYNTYGLTPSFDTDLNYYNYYSYLDQSGSGFNFKFGLIARPLPVLRIGAAIHTPTYYNIWEHWNNQIFASYKDDSFSDDSPYGEYNYKFRTPLRFVGSLALVLGKRMIISADYEFDNYKSTEFKPWSYSDDYFQVLNSQISERFKNTNNIRGGIEIKLTPELGVRGGFGYLDTPYKNEYQDKKATYYTYSGGAGYRTLRYFVDLAYMMTKRSYDYYNYNWDSSWNDYHGVPEPARITSKDNQIILTLGFKF